MVKFLQDVVPVHTKSSEQIISSNMHSNIANFKFTYSIEIILICKDDLVLIPLKQAKYLFNFSNLSPLLICTCISNSVHLIDPGTLQYYWCTPFDSFATIMDLVEFIVLDVKPDYWKTQDKFVMADTQVVVASTFCPSAGTADNDKMMDYEVPSSSTSQICHTHTYLRSILQLGDTVMGYHLTNANFHSSNVALLGPGHIPNIILVKKAYPNHRKKSEAHT
ncbi:hypothetical protein H2248_011401 [Termitomyces sp. 'cryptogamus']|nr:hypothetical protein H2248_011401 [Termitomyces sp. 'cryptogamus']